MPLIVGGAVMPGGFPRGKHYGRARLFCQRVERLGYRFVHPWPILERVEGRSVMYFMVHAADHEEVPQLMRRVYLLATVPLDRAVLLEMKMTQNLEGKLRASRPAPLPP